MTPVSEAAMSVTAVIPARGGSKSVPRKNLRPLGGRPLLVWSIEVARQVRAIDRVIVSTDDDEIAQVARRHGAEVHCRSAHLATDEALVIDAIRELFDELNQGGEAPEVMVLLEPTCPLRSAEDVAECLSRLVVQGLDSVATFKAAEVNPHRTWRLDARGRPTAFIDGSDPWLPRQALPKAYQLNGAVYAFRPDRLPEDGKALLFGRSGAVIMPAERSVDIDREHDFVIVESLLRRAR